MLKTLALSTLIVSSPFAAYAGHDGDKVPGTDWIPMDQAVQRLHDMGYNDIVKIKPDDGYWKAKVVKDGARHKVLLDPHSGKAVANYQDKDD